MLIKTISARNGIIQTNEEVVVNSENICHIYIKMHPDWARNVPSPIFYNGQNYYFITLNSNWGTNNLYISEIDYRKLVNQQ